mmetsp:Transcript_6360/g.13915  ORF Transcript_6360/g.13915 Transcript_6360/m.13915 type:complete len:982 (+) Transcript_6360:190-3135(+)
MRLTSAAVALLANAIPSTFAAEECVVGAFELEFEGSCTPETVLEAYADQVFHAAGGTAPTCALSAEASFASKLAAAGLSTAQDLCDQVYKTQPKEAFTDAANRGTDITKFEQMFFNGLTDWQDEVETLYETDDYTRSSYLKEDAEAVRTFYESVAQGRRVAWPGELPNFKSSVTDADEMATCTTNAAMCCWPKDRQANDGNGNCATPYDKNCVDKDPADNTNLCFVDVERGNASTGSSVESGFLGYPEDNGNGEGAIHCHGLAWSNDVNHHTARYKANNLFFVSMYDHMYQRGYVKNIPGAPMCGCVEQMPTVSRSDCTQVDLTETIKITFDGAAFDSRLTHVHVDFNACRGINNRNNDLWAYAARLYDEGRMTAQQFGKVGRVLTNDQNCYHAVENAKAENGFVTAYKHDVDNWTFVAGRDEMKLGEHFGREAFNTAFVDQSLNEANPIIMRICPDCAETHKRIYYRRLTDIPDNFDLLHNILYYRSSSGQAGNIWNTDFTLHSTYEDAVSGDNPWKCRGDDNIFNYNAPFDGECSPTGARVQNQYSIFNWYPGPRPNVAYYVNKEENTGLQDYVRPGTTRAVGLTDVDIGNVGKAGNTLENDGTFHITGSGDDIWGYRDQFHYKSEPWEGDIDVSVRITEFSNPGNDRYAKAGIMLRSDNSDDATFAFAQLSAREGIFASHRRSKGNHAATTGSTYKVAQGGLSYQTSAWLRIVKKGDRVEYYRADGTAEVPDWNLHVADTILFPEDNYRVGLAVSSKRNDFLSEATFEDYSIETYNFPTSSPSISTAPTSWDPNEQIGGGNYRAGRYYESCGDNVEGSGDGIWGKSDSFFFHNEQKANGDFTITMFIDSFPAGGYLHARGGIMIRDSADPSAANAFVGAAGDKQGAVFQSRSAAGELTVHHKMIYANSINKFHVRLDKAGTVVTASYKIAAEDEWIELGTTELTLTGDTLLVGRAVTAGSPSEWSYQTLKASDYSVSV